MQHRTVGGLLAPSAPLRALTASIIGPPPGDSPSQSDRIGRSRTMILTILFYSLFTCLSAFSQHPWHMVVLRFFVAMGVAGERSAQENRAVEMSELLG